MPDYLSAKRLLTSLLLALLVALPGAAQEHDVWTRLLETCP